MAGVGDRFIEALAPEGVAVAFSSFSESGWNIKDGAQRTHQLNGLFTSKFGRPTTTFVAGRSMGGLIAIKLAEDYPTQYAGLLPICSVAGGTRRQAEWDSISSFSVRWSRAGHLISTTCSPRTRVQCYRRRSCRRSIRAPVGTAHQRAVEPAGSELHPIGQPQEADVDAVRFIRSEHSGIQSDVVLGDGHECGAYTVPRTAYAALDLSLLPSIQRRGLGLSRSRAVDAGRSEADSLSMRSTGSASKVQAQWVPFNSATCPEVAPP